MEEEDSCWVKRYEDKENKRKDQKTFYLQPILKTVERRRALNISSLSIECRLLWSLCTSVRSHHRFTLTEPQLQFESHLHHDVTGSVVVVRDLQTKIVNLYLVVVFIHKT